ncbi:MAG: hypothetical protein WD708_12495 [Kiritimatiellia bacterium]
MKTSWKILSLSASLLSFCATSIAQPGSGIRLGPMTVLTPEFTTSVNYNDNNNIRARSLRGSSAPLSRNESDMYFGNEAALYLTHLSNNSRYTAHTWYGRETYQDESQLDGERYGANTGWFWARPNERTTFKADFSYQKAVDHSMSSQELSEDSDIAAELVNVSERVERDIMKFTTNLSQALMTDVRGVFVFSYDDTDYEIERFNDRTRTEYIGELNYQYSPKTQPYTRAGIAFDDDDGLDGQAEKPFILIGTRYNPTSKLRMDAGVGYERYTRTPIGAFDQDGTPLVGEELEDSRLKYTFTLGYAATQKTRINFRAKNGYNSVASPGSSSREEIMMALNIRHQTTNQFNQSIGVSWREDDYLNPIPAGEDLIDEKKETIQYKYSVDYQTVRPWLSFFGWVSFEDGSSKIPGDSYTETAGRIGARLRY